MKKINGKLYKSDFANLLKVTKNKVGGIFPLKVFEMCAVRWTLWNCQEICNCGESNFEILFQVLKRTESALVEAKAVAKTYNSVFLLSLPWLPNGGQRKKWS